MCECIKLTNEKLAEQGLMLVTSCSLDVRKGVSLDFIRIHTVQADGNKRKKTVTFMPTFCPFCGERQVEPDKETV